MEFKGDILVDKCYNLKSENVFISPLSLFFALSMITNGASKNTKKELEKLLEDEIESINEGYKEYLEELPDVLCLASSTWTKEIDINEEFNEILKEFYNSKANTFTLKDTEKINNWVKDNTNGKINSIINKLDDSDIFLLLNAIYFKDNWMIPFKRNETKREVFENLNRKKPKVSMMHSEANFYFENEKAYAFAKDYVSRFCFFGILPKNKGDFNLKDLDIDKLINQRQYGKAKIGIPKLDFDYSMNLNEVLKSLGINEAFSQNANFSKISDYPLTISKVIQKTSFTIDEEGSEAAGTTCIGMSKGCIRQKDPIDIILNRPFAFMIYDNLYDIPLFIGKIVDL